jgi:hypothetical protein
MKYVQLTKTGELGVVLGEHAGETLVSVGGRREWHGSAGLEVLRLDAANSRAGRNGSELEQYVEENWVR